MNQRLGNPKRQSKIANTRYLSNVCDQKIAVQILSELPHSMLWLYHYLWRGGVPAINFEHPQRILNRVERRCALLFRRRPSLTPFSRRAVETAEMKGLWRQDNPAHAWSPPRAGHGRAARVHRIRGPRGTSSNDENSTLFECASSKSARRSSGSLQ